ncbi:MAG: aminotransferase class V-fold PLP-dependent enzyme [Oscillospiraceae bacterium]|nr:aminotransferase class V-fold PLP-dependent enzyme [Oscillospiraceae bacterium]
MTYLDNGATSFHKPETVYRAVRCALENCANPGRGGYTAAMAAAKTVLRCREQAAELFRCQPEQVVMTSNCTHGLNIAINTLVKPGARVVISGFEHNAVTRPLHARRAQLTVAGRKLFDWGDTLEDFENALRKGADAAIFTHVSNVFGYILPVYEMAELCKQYKVPFVVDAAQSAGMLPVDMGKLGADFIAMPGHKGLLGPQGTGLLLCGREPEALLQGGTGSVSLQQEMPDFLPDMAEAGTLNVPGIAGLSAGIAYVKRRGPERLLAREQQEAKRCGTELRKLGFRVFMGENQSGTVSFIPNMDCEEAAQILGEHGIAVRAGLHCAPLAHESAGTRETGTVRISFGHDAAPWQTGNLLLEAEKLAE